MCISETYLRAESSRLACVFINLILQLAFIMIIFLGGQIKNNSNAVLENF